MINIKDIAPNKIFNSKNRHLYILVFIVILYFIVVPCSVYCMEQQNIYFEQLYDEKKVEIIGDTDLSEGAFISIKVLDPNNEICHINQVTVDSEGKFVERFRPKSSVNGIYTAYICDMLTDTPILATQCQIDFFEPVEVLPITFKDSNGHELIEFTPGADVTVSSTIINNQDETLSNKINLYIALYSVNDGISTLKGCEAIGHILQSKEKYILEKTISIPSDINETYMLKAFVWDVDNKPYRFAQLSPCVLQADKYFTDTKTLYRDFAPGVINPDEGTIELTLKMDRPSNELGNAYNFAFSLLTSIKNENVENNILALFTPPKSQTGTMDVKIMAVIRNGTTSHYVNAPFNYTPNTEFNFAFAWRANDYLYLYQNGVEIGKTPMDAGIRPDLIPYNFVVEKNSPFYVQKMKISTKKLSASQLTSSPQQEFVRSADTSLIMVNSGADYSTVSEKYETTWNTNYSALFPAWRTETQCFTAGESVYFPIVSINYTDALCQYIVNTQVTDDSGNVILSKNTAVDVLNDGKYRINKILLNELNKCGFYKLTTSIFTLTGTEISQYQSSVSVLPKNDTNVNDGLLANYYGHHLPYDYNVSILNKINATMTRALFEEFYWHSLEPQNGVFNWKRLDEYVAECKKANIDIVGVLGYPPVWAAQVPTQEELEAAKSVEYRPSRWKPNSIDEWKEYVHEIVNRYKDDIQYWEVWNEVNFHPPYYPYSFSGTTEDYLTLLSTAYQEAKSANPNCKILVSGFAVPNYGTVDVEMPLLLTNAQYAQGYYDIYNVHGYLGPEAFENCINNLNIQRPGTKYWMTEEMPFQIEDEELRAFNVVDKCIAFLEKGYEKFFHLGISNDDVFTTSTTKSPTKCFQAAGILQNNLRKCDSYISKYDNFDNNEYFSLKHSFLRTDGKYLSILGSSYGEFDLYINGSVMSAQDIMGNSVNIEVVDGKSKIKLNKIVYIISNNLLSIENAIPTNELNLINNGGFENIEGDIGTGGLESGRPVGWICKETNNDIYPNLDCASGKYSIFMKSMNNDNNRIYQELSIKQPGIYKVSAKFKKLSANNLQTKIYLYDMITTRYKETLFTLTGSDYQECSTTFEVTNPMIKASIGFGISSAGGEVLIDDVKVDMVTN